MPSRYVVRYFAEDNYYHVFNRGVEKRNIFEDKQDYETFRYYLSIYLLPTEKLSRFYSDTSAHLFNKNLNKELDLISYCLMPNHFHLLFKQLTEDAISKLIKQLINAYTFYFNNKYKRVGSLMQGRFKAALIESEEQLLHVSRYIHLNPLAANLTTNLKSYIWSSYPEYTDEGDKHPTPSLCKKEIILCQFPSRKNYEKFVLDQANHAKELKKIKHLLIEQ